MQSHRRYSSTKEKDDEQAAARGGPTRRGVVSVRQETHWADAARLRGRSHAQQFAGVWKREPLETLFEQARLQGAIQVRRE